MCEDVDDVSAANEKTGRGYLTIPAMEGQEIANPSAAERVQARSLGALGVKFHVAAHSNKVKDLDMGRILQG